jgi:glutaredoxin
MRKIILILIGILLLFSLVKAQNSVCVYFFWGRGCPHCAEEKTFFQQLKARYPQLEIHDFEVYYNSSNKELFDKVAKAYNSTPVGVPMTFIGEKVFSGFIEGNETIFDQRSNSYVGYSGAIEEVVKEYLKKGIECPKFANSSSSNSNLLIYIGVIVLIIAVFLIFKSGIVKIEVRK